MNVGYTYGGARRRQKQLPNNLDALDNIVLDDTQTLAMRSRALNKIYNIRFKDLPGRERTQLKLQTIKQYSSRGIPADVATYAIDQIEKGQDLADALPTNRARHAIAKDACYDAYLKYRNCVKSNLKKQPNPLKHTIPFGTLGPIPTTRPAGLPFGTLGPIPTVREIPTKYSNIPPLPSRRPGPGRRPIGIRPAPFVPIPSNLPRSESFKGNFQSLREINALPPPPPPLLTGPRNESLFPLPSYLQPASSIRVNKRLPPPPKAPSFINPRPFQPQIQYPPEERELIGENRLNPNSSSVHSSFLQDEERRLAIQEEQKRELIQAALRSEQERARERSRLAALPGTNIGPNYNIPPGILDYEAYVNPARVGEEFIYPYPPPLPGPNARRDRPTGTSLALIRPGQPPFGRLEEFILPPPQ